MIGYRLSLFLMRAAWTSRALLARLRGQKVPGVRVVILSGDRAVLVRHWYAPFVWTLPGGGICENETPEAAAIREVREETGLIIDSLLKLGTYPQGQGSETTVYVARTDAALSGLRNVEILESCYWPISALPKNLYPGALRWITKAQQG